MTRAIIKRDPMESAELAAVLQPYIEKYQGKITILLPQLDKFELWSSYHTINTNLVQFSAGAAHFIDGRYMHTKAMLDTIATHAHAKVLDINRPETEEHVFTREVIMEIILSDGSSSQTTDEKTLDLRDNGEIAERSRGKLHEQIANARAGKKTARGEMWQYPKGFLPKRQDETDEAFEERAKEFVEASVMKEIRQSRVFGYEKATTGAKGRCLRDLMGLKLSWEKDEFEWPILIVTAKLDMTKIIQAFGEKAFLQKLSEVAFAGMSGGQIPGGVSGFLERMEGVKPEDIIETEMQPVDEEPAPADVEEELSGTMTIEVGHNEISTEPILEQSAAAVTEQQVQVVPKQPKDPKVLEKLDADLNRKFQAFMAECGRPGFQAINSTLGKLWPGVNLGNVNRLQAKICCQYVKKCFLADKENKEAPEDEKKSGRFMQSVHDAWKIHARKAYEGGMDFDEHFKRVNVTPAP